MHLRAISLQGIQPAFGLAKVTNGDGPNDKGKRPAGLKAGDAAILFTDGLESAADFRMIENGPKTIADFFAEAPKDVVNTTLSLPTSPTPIMRLVTTEAIPAAQKIAILSALNKTAAQKIDFIATDTQGKTVFDHAYAQGHEMFYHTVKLLYQKPAAERNIHELQSAFGEKTTYPAILRATRPIKQETANRVGLIECVKLEDAKENLLDGWLHLFVHSGHLVEHPRIHPSLKVDDQTFAFIVKKWPLFKRLYQTCKLSSSFPALQDRMRNLGLLKKK